jgi:superfamily II DNA/RNA helicase
LGTARLAIYLEKQGVSSTAIHGDKTQAERTKSLEAFKAGEVTVLVATDVAARGLDIADLPCVINYDLPTTPEDYVHRIGRTGRAGAKGTAYSFVVKRDERYLKDIEKLVNKAFVREELEGFVPGARAPREERGGREGRNVGRSESRGAPRTEGRTEGRSYEGRSDRRPARTGDEAASARERRPARDTSYQGARFNDNAPIHRDAEYERLRAKLAQTRVKDSLFNQPYQESKEDKAAAEASASGQATAGNNQTKSKTAAPVAFLLGGNPRN